MNVLISLYPGYGMGDGVQMSAVLRHVKKYLPHWVVDYQADAGRHCVGRGLVQGETFEHGENPNPDKRYDAEVQICLYDTWANWRDRPNTRVSSCLHEVFGLPWDAECGRYVVNVRQEVLDSVAGGLLNWAVPHQNIDGHRVESPWVALHYKGDSSPDKKNMSDEQADQICDAIRSIRKHPLLIDWRNTSPLSKRDDLRSTGGMYCSREWGRDAEHNCAIISQCAAFVGIDSGPSKCASATNTPALVTWTGHHPAQFHDPAPNTTHLVPRGYHGLEPVGCDPGVVKWFETHYNTWTYDADPVREIKEWLRRTMT